MIEHVYSIPCEKTLIDQETNTITIQNVIEQLTIFSEPIEKGILPIRIELLSLWIRKDPNTSVRGKSRISFISPTGKNYGSSVVEIDLEGAERVRNRLQFTQLPLEMSGRHKFVIELLNDDKWITVASIPLSINFTPPENALTTDTK